MEAQAKPHLWAVPLTGVVDSIVDFDAFAFTIPVNMQLVGGSVVLNDVTADVTFVDWDLHAGSANASTGPIVGTYGGSSPSATIINPLTSNTYNVSPTGLGGSVDRTANYTFTFGLINVPEPASPGLLALAPLFLRRR